MSSVRPVCTLWLSNRRQPQHQMLQKRGKQAKKEINYAVVFRDRCVTSVDAVHKETQHLDWTPGLLSLVCRLKMSLSLLSDASPSILIHTTNNHQSPTTRLVHHTLPDHSCRTLPSREAWSESNCERVLLESACPDQQLGHPKAANIRMIIEQLYILIIAADPTREGGFTKQSIQLCIPSIARATTYYLSLHFNIDISCASTWCWLHRVFNGCVRVGTMRQLWTLAELGARRRRDEELSVAKQLFSVASNRNRFDPTLHKIESFNRYLKLCAWGVHFLGFKGWSMKDRKARKVRWRFRRIRCAVTNRLRDSELSRCCPEMWSKKVKEIAELMQDTWRVREIVGRTSQPD